MFNWLIERAKRTPYEHLPGYMNRYWLVPEAWKDSGTWVNPWERPIAWCIQKLGLGIRIHELLRKDRGRDRHNHPWKWFISIVLKGGYYELLNDEKEWIWRPSGSIALRRRDDFHKITYVRPGTVTMVITGPYVGGWGFDTPEGYVDRKYYGHDP